jgi:hypothetical protein
LSLLSYSAEPADVSKLCVTIKKGPLLEALLIKNFETKLTQLLLLQQLVRLIALQMGHDPQAQSQLKVHYHHSGILL